MPDFVNESSAFQGAQHFSIINSTFNMVQGNYIHTINNTPAKSAIDIGRFKEWLTPPDPSTNHNNAIKQHHPGTGAWLLSHPAYLDWKCHGDSFVWINGISGSGKTVLCSTLIEDIKRIANRGITGLAYFYFDISDERKRTVMGFLSSMVLNLLVWAPANQSTLDKVYADCHSGLHKPSDMALLEVLKNFISGFQETYIFIDGLDECFNVEEMLELVKSIHGWHIDQCHLLVTSRKEQSIVNSFSLMHVVPAELDLSCMPIDVDIGNYINHVLHSSSELKRWEQDAKNLIKQTLLAKSGGMFRWVTCQLEELKKCRKSLKALKTTLDGLPDTLEATYNQILNRISPVDAPEAVKLLLWLAFAKEPLPIQELVIIVEFDVEQNIFDPDAKLTTPEDVLKICSSLVTKMDGNTVQLAHASVKEYILQSPRVIGKGIRMDPTFGNLFVGTCCILYVLQWKEKVKHPHFAHASLIRYSTRFWPMHILEGKNELDALTYIKELFQSYSIPFQNWKEGYNSNISEDEEQMDSSHLQCAAINGLSETVKWLMSTTVTDMDIFKALCAASYKGHKKIVTFILQSGIYVNLVNWKPQQDQHDIYCTALQAASLGGHQDIVKQLLEAGVDVNVQGGNYGNALQAASHRCHRDIVELLLEGGADVNAWGGKYDNALHAALQYGHLDTFGLFPRRQGDVNVLEQIYNIVELLLERGANVNSWRQTCGNALQAASWFGHKEIVGLLLERGADVDVQGGTYGNPLHTASYKGHKGIVELLLERGADVNIQGQKYGSALSAASYKGHNDIVKLLLGRGANVNLQGGRYGNALNAALYRGEKQTVELLLERGANVNAQGGKHGNALYIAASKPSMDIVELLIEKGADVNTIAQSGRYCNAFHAVSYVGNKHLVELFLNRGVNINAQGGKYGNALNAACLSGHKEIVKLLLEKGADINSQEQEYCNALHTASHKGHRDIVVLLLEGGMDVNSHGGEYGTALHAASYKGHMDIVQLLLEKGADINFVGRRHGSVLQMASCFGHKDIVKLLLERGADVNTQGGEYGNALQAALHF
ncbi:hypothetical protein AX15_007917 [Amanita polypyramis BW_CC]|nr:hypothetical protein AX15_007917 [Amanita polypyramis BW_CC]